jgi:hypothetical protein
VAPGTFKVTLEVDGVATESRTYTVRADPASAVTLLQHKAREAFVVDVMDLQAKIERLVTDVRARRAAATGEEATRLQGLETRLVGGGAGGRGGRGPSTSSGQAAPAPAPIQPVRTRLSGLINAFVGSGARTGTMTAPTGTMRAALAEAKVDLASIENEIARR